MGVQQDLTTLCPPNDDGSTALCVADPSLPAAALRPKVVEVVDGMRGERLRLPISALRAGDSPRSGGIDQAHVARLMESDRPLPPILVHRLGMRVIDGWHRLEAAKRKGFGEIEALVLDGPPEAAFVLAVSANVTHGLPLTLADRRAAATKIMDFDARWSDRSIATAVGLSAKTIRGIRRASGEDAQLHERMGQDGRVRPVNTAAGRQLAAQLLEREPTASLRNVAARAGISPGTVRDVRARLKRGEDPVLTTNQTQVGARTTGWPPDEDSPPFIDVKPVLVALSRDPAFRMNEASRDLLRWLQLHAVNAIDTSRMAESVPDHCVDHLVELAARCASNWAQIAKELSQRSTTGPVRVTA